MEIQIVSYLELKINLNLLHISIFSIIFGMILPGILRSSCKEKMKSSLKFCFYHFLKLFRLIHLYNFLLLLDIFDYTAAAGHFKNSYQNHLPANAIFIMYSRKDIVLPHLLLCMGNICQ